MSCVKFSVERDVFRTGFAVTVRLTGTVVVGFIASGAVMTTVPTQLSPVVRPEGLMVTPIGVGDAPFVVA